MQSDQDLYALPKLYDVLHAAGTAREARGILRVARDNAAKPGPWLEPACGTGRYLLYLAAQGHEVHGYDLERAMVDYASRAINRRRLAGRAAVAVAGMTDPVTPPGPYAFAFNLVNTIRHLMTRRDLLQHLELTRRALAPSAVYCVGLNTSRPGDEHPSEDVWTGRRGALHVHQVIQYLPPGPAGDRETVISHITETTPSRTRDVASSYQLRCWTPEHWREIVTDAGFTHMGCCDDAGAPIPPGERTDTRYTLHLLRKR